MKQRRMLCVFLVLVMLLAILPMGTFAEEALPFSMSFTDVRQGAWYASNVQAAYEHGIMQGVGDNRFDPQGAFTRAASAAVLFRLTHGRVANTADSRNNPFADVPDNWIAPYVTWAWSQSVVQGTSPTTFAPNDNITRQEIVTMLYRFAGFQNRDVTVPATVDLNHFADGDEVANWARTAMIWASYTGLVQGRGNVQLAPTATLTRAEAATMMMRFLEEDLPPSQSTSIDLRTALGMSYRDFVREYGHLLGERGWYIWPDNPYEVPIWAPEIHWTRTGSEYFRGANLFVSRATLNVGMPTSVDTAIGSLQIEYFEFNSDENSVVHFDGINHRTTREEIRAAFGTPISDDDRVIWQGANGDYFTFYVYVFEGNKVVTFRINITANHVVMIDFHINDYLHH